MKVHTKYLVVAIIAFMVGVVSEYWFLTSIWPNRHQAYTWIFTLRNHKKPGEPCETDRVLDRQGYSLGYSYKQKSALWVSYIISADSVEVNVGRHNNFYADPDIPQQYRVQPEDHLNTGYDKGHLAPSATIDFSKKANQETFALSNIVFQESRLNRQAWNTLETAVRKWTKTKGKLYVVTGPLYSSRPKKINGLPVPKEFYKVIYSYKGKQALGFILPNKPVPNADVWNYAMSVQEVEKKTGLTFFKNFKPHTQKKLKETLELEWWQKSY
jgi:endonuclease G